jgi:type IV pilus assembly protein PilN
MKININLASQPYEDAKRFYLQWLPLLVGLLALTALVSAKSWQNFRDSRTVAGQISDEQAKIEALDKEKQEARTTLEEPQNSGTHDQAKFLNELFAKKAFSWTTVLSDLEKLMPAQIQVTSIKPDLKNGQLYVVLGVSTTERDSANELVRRMETSEHFVGAQIREETYRNDSSDKDKKAKLVITALYKSGPPRAEGGQNGQP